MACVYMLSTSETKPLNIKRDAQVNGLIFFGLCYSEQRFVKLHCKGGCLGNLREMMRMYENIII